MSAIDADSRTVGDDAFTFVGALPVSGDPETGVLYVVDNGISTTIQADTTGDGVFDLEITVDAAKTLFAGGFVL